MRNKSTLRTSVFCFVVVMAVLGVKAFAQMNGEFTAKMAENSQKLKQYTYMQKTEVYMNGVLKKTQLSQVRYDATTGQKIVVPMGTPEASQPQAGSGRLGGRFVQKKMAEKQGEMKEYTQRLTGLMSDYLPPNPDRIKAAMPNAQMARSPEGNGIQISLKNYLKPGDTMALSISPLSKQLSQIRINSTLDTDPVTFAVNFSQLPDGTNYPALTTLQSPAKNLEIRVSTSDYRK